MDEKLFVELYPRKCQILFDMYHHYKFTNLKCLFQVTVIILRNEQAAQKPFTLSSRSCYYSYINFNQSMLHVK